MTTKSPHVLVIIINWRQPHTTLECLEAVRAMTYRSLNILVIDNGSSDGSPSILKEAGFDVELMALPENLGFATGSNIGLRYAITHGYDYALLLNNDAFPAPDMLDRLTAVVKPDIGLLSPKIYYETEPQRIWFAGGRQHPVTLDLRETGRGQIDGPQQGRSRDVHYLLGTCLLVNLAVLNSVGFFDEKYFMYYEDLDWSLRMRQAGYRLRLVEDAHLFHRVAVSSGGLDSPLRRYHLARSSVIFWRSHARLGSPWIIALFRFGSTIKLVNSLLLKGKIAGFLAHLRGLRDGWKMSSAS